PVNANSANYAVALLRKDPGGGSKVIGTLNDQKIVATMITALLPKKARPMTPSRMRKAEAKAIWHLNRFLHKELKLERGKPKNNDLALFKKAIDSLKEIPELRAKYFEGETGFSAEVDSLKKIYRLKVQNPDFHVLDPGRYIKGAKEGALVPYEFDRSLAFNYDERQRDFPGLIGYLNSVPRRRKQESPSSTAGDVTKLAGEPANAEEAKIDATPKKELTEA
uniref:hypothetical protein n=1 Tax=Sphingomonas daechungensis TaxID=1176646 RepID=UPI00378492B8